MGLKCFIVARLYWASWSLEGNHVGFQLRCTRYVNRRYPMGSCPRHYLLGLNLLIFEYQVIEMLSNLLSLEIDKFGSFFKRSLLIGAWGH
jgi:hypothetical protein